MPDTDTVALRAEIDTQTVRGLQLINGGTAAGLTAILPNVLQHPSLATLANAMMWAVGFAAFGLFAAIVHNRLRRKCSLAHDIRPFPPSYTSRIMRTFASNTNEPKICTRSVIWMWASIVAFALGATSVIAGGWQVLGQDVSPTTQCWELVTARGQLARFNTCTGELMTLNRSSEQTASGPDSD